MSQQDYMRQRWTVSDPFKGYDKEAHYWYIPTDNIIINKAKPDTFIKQFNWYRSSMKMYNLLSKKYSKILLK